MPPTNSLGAAAPKQRTINVEVNLLAEWVESRNRMREERLRWTALLTTVAVVAMVALPFLSEYAARANGRAEKAAKVLASKEAFLASLQEKQSLVQPTIDGEATLKLSQNRNKRFYGEMLAVLNASSPKMAMEMLDASIIGGEMTLRGKAQAEDYLSAQDFVSLTGQTAHVKSSILTTARPNIALGKDGVTFEFAKKVALGK